jgi:hypothetical protein
MSNSLIDLNALSHFKLLQDAYNANTYAEVGDVPTKTSDLTNDSGFITASSLPTVNDATLTIIQNGTTVATFTANSATNTSAAITVPTVVSDLTNDADYQTGSQVSSAIATAIAGITGIQFEIVQTLPATGDAGTIYLVSHGGSGTDIYDEYVYVNNAWEKLGTTSADFTDVAYYDSVNNQLKANNSMFWEIADNTDIATLFA